MMSFQQGTVKRDLNVKTNIVQALKEKGPCGYNMLYDEVHKLTRCGRNQFNRYLKKLREESVIYHKHSYLHKQGVILELGENGYKYLEGQNFYFFAQSLLTHLLPFSESRETGSIEEQLAAYDLKKMLPFKIKTELNSVGLGRTIVASASFDKKGKITQSKVNVIEKN